jgi:hypothetical protein
MESGDTALLQALRSLIGDREGIEPWRLNTRALELEGYMPGDIVLVDLNASPQAGDAVYATIREQSRVEPIMRKFQPTGIVDLLVPRTNDPDAPADARGRPQTGSDSRRFASSSASRPHGGLTGTCFT